MMHVAMADAVTSIHPRYKPYAIRVTGHRDANKIAAAASAAYGVLVRLFPGGSHSSMPRLQNRSHRLAMARKRTEASALGDEVAAQIVALRENDGSATVCRTLHPSASGSGNPIRALGLAPSCPGRR